MLFLTLLIEALKAIFGHVDFTANFKISLFLNMVRDASDGETVVGDILTDSSISAGGSGNQISILVDKRAGKTIDFHFTHIIDHF